MRVSRLWRLLVWVANYRPDRGPSFRTNTTRMVRLVYAVVSVRVRSVVFTLSVFTLFVFTLSVFTLSVFTLFVFTLSVFTLSVFAVWCSHCPCSQCGVHIVRVHTVRVHTVRVHTVRVHTVLVHTVRCLLQTDPRCRRQRSRGPRATAAGAGCGPHDQHLLGSHSPEAGAHSPNGRLPARWVRRATG